MRYVIVLFLLFALSVSADTRQVRKHQFEPKAPMLKIDGMGNLLAGATLQASGHWDRQTPEKVLDGDRSAGSHWACEILPAELTLTLPEVRTIGEVHLWLYYDGSRSYQFTLDARKGGAWTTLIDRSGNTEASPATGYRFPLDVPMVVDALRITITGGNRPQSGGHVVEIAAYSQTGVGRGLQGAAGRLDERYHGSRLPEPATRDWRGEGWRGERVNGSFVLWTGEDLDQLRLVATDLIAPSGAVISADQLTPQFVRFVNGDGRYLPDIIDPVRRLSMPAGSLRPVWLQVDVPAGAAPGVYRGTLTARAAGAQRVDFPLQLEVLSITLPPPADWAFHLDLWQHPFAVARYHDVPLWSEEHWALLRPLLTRLADAGQKILTTTITHRPWNQQTFDAYDSMIPFTRHADGSWSYDYRLFDHYVAFGKSCGITAQVNCYTLIPWGNRFFYTDAVTGDLVSFDSAPGTDIYAEFWAGFLSKFQEHLRSRGWLDHTMIAMDERPAEWMRPAIELIHQHAPELRISLAGNHSPDHYQGLGLDEFSIVVNQANQPLYDQIPGRTAAGQITTFYVCTGPPRPNTFLHSPPAEAVWLGYHAAAKRFSGILRWATNHWGLDPLYDTTFGNWPAADTLLLYPGGRSSVRFELLRDGIEEYEKIRLLRTAGAGTDALRQLEAALTEFDVHPLGSDEEVRADVTRGRAAVTAAARAVGTAE